MMMRFFSAVLYLHTSRFLWLLRTTQNKSRVCIIIMHISLKRENKENGMYNEPRQWCSCFLGFNRRFSFSDGQHVRRRRDASMTLSLFKDAKRDRIVCIHYSICRGGVR
jgi:hypothetical protein